MTFITNEKGFWIIIFPVVAENIRTDGYPQIQHWEGGRVRVRVRVRVRFMVRVRGRGRFRVRNRVRGRVRAIFRTQVALERAFVA